MHLSHLWLTDFRSYPAAELVPAPAGLTVVEGANGEGKTNLLEAIGYLATLRSFRGAPADAMVRTGAESAIVRAEAEREGRAVLIEAELRRVGRDRVQVNRQPLRRTRDLLGALVVTVFAPDDLALVKAGPGGRRDYLDDLLVALHPRHDATQGELDRVLKQRNALLKSSGGRANPDVTATLDVWDAKLAAAGETLVAARQGLTGALSPVASEAYAALATASPQAGAAGRGRDVVALSYQRSWSGPLDEALAGARAEDLRRGVTTVGPHRDELDLFVGGLPARTHASQGEQRSLALALRLAGHRIVTDRIGSAPVLLLDDVFSELDPFRAGALLAGLPEGQALLTTASGLPPGATPAVTARLANGTLVS
ncbi:MAG: DNA replication/repair protein RecF [Actinomycetota bacterium]|nr:DNA replication/repair protein RecF [Actinomycetota bacterium]